MNKLTGIVAKTMKTIIAELSGVVVAVITIGMFLLAAAYC